MAEIFDSLHKASFRGIEFSIEGEATTTGGRKTVTHEYPNSPNRITEDLGFLPKKFSINGVISGVNYIEQKISLIRALETEGIGVLLHPWFGTLNVVSTTFSISENQNKLGRVDFTMSFEIQEGQLTPLQSPVNPSAIEGLKEIASDQSLASIIKNFKVVGQTIETYNQGKNKILSIAAEFDKQRKTVTNAIFSGTDEIRNIAGEIQGQIIEVLELLRPIPGQILSDRDDVAASLNEKINDFKTDIDLLLAEPAKLAVDLQALFQDVEVLAQDTLDQFRLLEGFFDFGDDDLLVDPITPDRQQRNDNTTTLTEVMQANALASAYNTAAQIQFTDEEQLADIKDSLEEQFQKVINFKNIDASLRFSIIDLRQATLLFLDQVQADVARILNVEVAICPSSIISFNFFGVSDRGEEIMTLNQSVNPAFIGGNIKVLSA